MKKCLTFFAVILTVAWASWSPPLYSQTPVVRNLPSFVTTPEFERAQALVKDVQTRDQGVSQFLDIAAHNPGTSLGAQSLFAAAYFGEDVPKARQIYQQIVSNYSNSRFDMAARISLLHTDSSLSKGNWSSRVEQIIQNFGGPSAAVILADRRRALLAFVGQPQELQDGFAGLYLEFAKAFAGVQDYQRAIAVATFGAEVWANDDEGIGDRYRGLVEIYTAAPSGGIKPYDTVIANPKVHILSPARDRITGPRPTISLKTWTGDYTHVAPSLRDSDFLLDGHDIKPQVLAHVQFGKAWRQGPEQIWEKDTWSFRPVQPLSPGRHVLSVVVRVVDYKQNVPLARGATALNWTFTVGHHHDDPGDDDDHLCDGPEDGNERDDADGHRD